MSESLGMPKSIKLFEGLYLCVWVISFLQFSIIWISREQLVSDIFESPIASVIVIPMLLFLLFVPIVLVFFVSRKRSRVCKWMLVVLVCLSSVVASLFSVVTSNVGEGGGLGFILSVLFLVLFPVLALLVGRRRSLLVRIILVALAVLVSMIVVPFLFSGIHHAESGVGYFFSIVHFLMQFVAMLLLFTESSGEWLSLKVLS